MALAAARAPRMSAAALIGLPFDIRPKLQNKAAVQPITT
jgi:hypothetical protein